MTTSTNLISGLSSGIDWKTMVDQLIAIDRRQINILKNKKNLEETKLEEWRSLNTRLLAFKNAAETLSKSDTFKTFKVEMTSSSGVKASELLSASAEEVASPGTYSLRIINTAQSHKLSSNPFGSESLPLGSDFTGDIVINGKVVTINATDNLLDFAAKINEANTGANPSGVTASIIKFSEADYRLILTSDRTGARGINLANGNAANLIQRFGWKDNKQAIINNPITNGAQSNQFFSANVSVKTLLGLSNGETGLVTIGDKAVTINLNTMSLTDIKNAINDAAPTGVKASIVSKSVNGVTTYRLQISGTQSFVDAGNILNTIGILDYSTSDIAGKISGNSMTSNGSYITASTLLRDIDGYITFETGDYIAITGQDTSNPSNNVNAQFNIQANSTVQDLLNEIKTQFGNVLAYITSDGKIRVDDLSGNGNLRVNLAAQLQNHSSKLMFVDNNDDFGTASIRKREIIAGADAKLELDGVLISKPNNNFDDLIPGIKFNFLKEDPSTSITLKVTRNLDAIKQKIQNFVTKYNDVASFINTQFAFDEKTNKTGGALFADGTLVSIKSDLTSLITKQIWGVNNQFSTLGLAGITVDSRGQLSINDSVLSGYLQTNFSDILNLFVGRAVVSGTDIFYVSHSKKSKAGEYNIRITSAATKSSLVSTTSVNNTLGADEILTITEGNKEANISLTSSMSINDIVYAVNYELSKVYSQKLAGSLSLMQRGGAIPITSETTWENIEGTSLQNGDIINFSGTSRNGSVISGSYKINNIASDKIQGLLSAIQSAFSNEVQATIDPTGKIEVTDIYSGASQLSLGIDAPSGRDLDFGSVLKTNAGGRVGRYALDIDAAKDSENRLVLTSKNYGAGFIFNISETNNLLWTEGNKTADNGKDVEGTIGGENATGVGQILSGASGNPSTDGLVVKYTGSLHDFDAGTVKLTLGIAELFNRILFNITDQYEGYASFKQTSIKNSINDYQSTMDNMDTQLERKRTFMMNRFIAMEAVLSKIQNQSKWLAAQIETVNKSWTWK